MKETAMLDECSLQITAELIRQYGVLTNDDNPIHTDPVFAAATPMGGVIAHGTLSLSLIWQSIVSSLGSASVDGSVLDIRFVAPVRVNDVITASGRKLADDPNGYEIWAVNQKGEKAITGTFVTTARTTPHGE